MSDKENELFKTVHSSLLLSLLARGDLAAIGRQCFGREDAHGPGDSTLETRCLRSTNKVASRPRCRGLGACA